jgi:hypothetical protein
VAFAPETIVHEINAILLCFERNAVHKGALASIAAVSAREMKADVGVGARDGLAGVERNTAARGGGFSILEVAIAPVLPDKFTVPNVVPARVSENAAGLGQAQQGIECTRGAHSLLPSAAWNFLPAVVSLT